MKAQLQCELQEHAEYERELEQSQLREREMEEKLQRYKREQEEEQRCHEREMEMQRQAHERELEEERRLRRQRERELEKMIEEGRDSDAREGKAWNAYGSSELRRVVLGTSEKGVMHNIEVMNGILASDGMLWALTGVYAEDFERMLGKFRAAMKAEGAPLFRDDDGRKHDVGNRCKLYPKHVVLLTLLYMKVHVTQQGISALTGVNQSTVSRYVRFTLRAMKDELPTPEKMLEHIKKAETVEDFKKIAPGDNGGQIKTDGTFVPVQRPSDSKQRKEMYSGKNKSSGINALVVSNRDKIIIAVGKGKPGKTHDITAAREDLKEFGPMYEKMTDPDTPEEERIEVQGDLGYQGLDKDLPGANVKVPIKKPKGGKLTKEQKKFNREFSRVRVGVEHAIGGIKQYAIMRGPFIGTLDDFDLVFNVVCGLANLRRMRRDGTYDKWMEYLREPPPS